MDWVEERVRDDRASRLHSFDSATERYLERAAGAAVKRVLDRGWRREELYRLQGRDLGDEMLSGEPDWAADER